MTAVPSRKLPALFIACTALLAVGVFFVRGNSCGHDFDFHLLSWMEVARAWHQGLVSPHWVQDANYGAGEPRLVFYPPGSWLLGALLGSVVGWHAAPVLFVLIVLLTAGGAMYLLAREWAPPASATVAACLYVANPYALFVAYERAAFGELLATAWLPLLVLFAMRRQSSIAPLGLSVAALWLSNSPAGVVGCYLLAFLAAGMWLVEGTAWPAFRALGGLFLGLGLAAFYIVPAAFEQRWVQIDRAIILGMRVEDSFLFMHTKDAFHDQVLHTASWIVVVEISLACVAALLVWRKRSGGTARIVLTTLLPVILLLQLPVSDFIWKYAPRLKYLQFPWRWLLALSIVGCVLTAMAIPARLTRWRPLLAGFLIAALAIGGGVVFFQPCDEEDAVTPRVAAFASGDGVEGTDEYTPIGADNTDVQQHLPLVRVLRDADDDVAESDAAGNAAGDNPEWHVGPVGTIAARVDAQRLNEEQWLIHVASPQAGYAVLRLMDFPSWRVSVDGTTASMRPTREDGLMAVPVTAGAHTIAVQWSPTQDVIAGRALSALSLLALVLVGIRERRLMRNRRV